MRVEKYTSHNPMSARDLGLIEYITNITRDGTFKSAFSLHFPQVVFAAMT